MLFPVLAPDTAPGWHFHREAATREFRAARTGNVSGALSGACTGRGQDDRPAPQAGTFEFRSTLAWGTFPVHYPVLAP